MDINEATVTVYRCSHASMTTGDVRKFTAVPVSDVDRTRSTILAALRELLERRAQTGCAAAQQQTGWVLAVRRGESRDCPLTASDPVPDGGCYHVLYRSSDPPGTLYLVTPRPVEDHDVVVVFRILRHLFAPVRPYLDDAPLVVASNQPRSSTVRMISPNHRGAREPPSPSACFL
jgi:hypothetical protein